MFHEITAEAHCTLRHLHGTQKISGGPITFQIPLAPNLFTVAGPALSPTHNPPQEGWVQPSQGALRLTVLVTSRFSESNVFIFAPNLSPKSPVLPRSPL